MLYAVVLLDRTQPTYPLRLSSRRVDSTFVEPIFSPQSSKADRTPTDTCRLPSVPADFVEFFVARRGELQERKDVTPSGLPLAGSPSLPFG